MKSTIRRIAIPLVVAALAPAAARGQTVSVDTLIQLDPSGRLELHNLSGRIDLATWERSAVRVRAERPSDVPLRIEKSGSTLEVRPDYDRRNRRDSKKPVRFEVTVPASLDLEVHGVESPVSIAGAGGRVEVHTVKGAVAVRGGRGSVEIHSVTGEVTVTGARGDVEVHSVNEPVTLTDVRGDVRVNVVNGGVNLERVDARRVKAATVNGKIRYAGTIADDGRYDFNSHNGGIEILVPRDANARFQVATFNGTFRAHFPIELRESRAGKRFDFTLGSGAGSVQLQSFNGTIEVRRR